MATWQKLALLAAAGMVGTLARYGVAGWVQQFNKSGSYPFGTLAVNAIGCFLFGMIWAAAENRLSIGPGTRVFIFTGFLGAFTTFSTFAFETSQMVRQGQWLLAGGNLIGQNMLGLVLVLVGLKLGALL